MQQRQRRHHSRVPELRHNKVPVPDHSKVQVPDHSKVQVPDHSKARVPGRRNSLCVLHALPSAEPAVRRRHHSLDRHGDRRRRSIRDHDDR